jgi:hypothetical protein
MLSNYEQKDVSDWKDNLNPSILQNSMLSSFREPVSENSDINI